ncbi:MAG: radical SAM protein [Syntrophobacteraceae bacterium]|nr:radical SAM protein [Syntrophobacteraceae bacterium]
MDHGNSALHLLLNAGLKPPKTLTVSITNGCNLGCAHCWPQSRHELTESPVPAQAVENLITEFVRFGLEEVVVTGGEPLTHPDWLAILAWCCQQPDIRSVCLQTNGTLLSEVAVNGLVALGRAGLSVQVSLDGATEKTHDYVRGKGSFERALCGLRELVQGGLGSVTRVAFTEMRHNFDEIPSLLDILSEMGVGGLVTGALVRKGRAAASHRLALPTPSQYRKLLERYHLDPGFRLAYERIANISVIEWYKGRAHGLGGVCRCIESPYVTADGRMYPCALLQADECAAVNVYGRSLAEVLCESLPLWSKLPETSRRRALELKRCRRCPGLPHCGGGCMGRAHAAHGQFMREEDRCLLRKVAYTFCA